MLSVYVLKPRFQALLRPLCRSLASVGVRANQVTITAGVLSAAGGAWIALDPTSPWPYLALPLFLFLRMALNAIDGMLAREFDMASPLGALLNELGDVLSDLALYLPLGLHPDVPWWGIVAVVILAVIVELAGVLSLQIGASRRYDGPFGKSDRALAFCLLSLLLGLGVPGGEWLAWAFGIALALSALTIVNRIRNALRNIGEAA